MAARINTVAFHGIDVLDVLVQMRMAPGLPAFTIDGSVYPDPKNPRRTTREIAPVSRYLRKPDPEKGRRSRRFSAKLEPS